VDALNYKDVRDLLKRPAKVAKEYAAE
jgi:hypothetical protein